MSDFSWLEWVGAMALLFASCLCLCFIAYIVIRIRKETKLEHIRQDLVNVIKCIDEMEPSAPIRAEHMRDLLVHVHDSYAFSLSNFKSNCEFYQEDEMEKRK